MSAPVTAADLRYCAYRYGSGWDANWIDYRSRLFAAADALEAANKRIAELEAELDAARRWYRL